MSNTSTTSKTPRKAAAKAAPAAKTTAGRDKQTDEQITAWVTAQDAASEEPAKVGTLLRKFHEAGFGANPKRFGRLVETARAEAKPAPKRRTRSRKATS